MLDRFQQLLGHGSPSPTVNMENYTAYRNQYWDLTKGAYTEIDELPLMEAPGTMLIILAAYLAFVLRIGPQFMRKRQPYKLTNVMLIYNAAQVAISAYLVQRFFRNVFLEFGVTPKKCYMADDNARKEIVMGIYLYFCAKITELLDTVFFVLRKKDNQVTFLHLYHHFIMVFGTWPTVKYWPTQSLLFIGLLNSLVHVFMYTYYGLAGLGPRAAKYLVWKKYMTTMQLVQFVSMIIHFVTAVNVSDCPSQKGYNVFVTCNIAFFLVLFCNFYRKTYNKKKAV